MIRQYRLVSETLYVDSETNGLSCYWLPSEFGEYGVFFVVDESGIDVLVPEKESELFSVVESRNEKVRVESLSFSRKDLKEIEKIEKVLAEVLKRSERD